MNEEEAKKMIGTEFTYEFEDGDTIEAYVKKFDPEIGLSCLSLDTKTARDGWFPRPGDPALEEDGTWCLIAYDFSYHDLPEDLEEALETLRIIRDEGRFLAGSLSGDEFYRETSCAFR